MKAWKSSVANAKSQLEHQHNRTVNLELLEQYGSSTLIAHNQATERTIEAIKARALEVENQILHVNAERKRSQELARPQLDKLSRRREEALGMSFRIAASCAQLDPEGTDISMGASEFIISGEDDQEQKRMRTD